MSCAQCHGDEARASLASVHSLSSPRLVARPVLCKDCHSYHDVLSPADERSPLSALRRPLDLRQMPCGRGSELRPGPGPRTRGGEAVFAGRYRQDPL
ncbi:MAG: hypothetical protein MZU84_08835 [Sphingobacterium sp.]|nr:hypothetical protein [Sphingobacterium sp.]